MMRRPLTTLTLVALCGSLVPLTAWAATVALAPSAGAGAGRAAATVADLSRADASAERTWRVALSPAPGELTLAEIGFPASGRERISDGSLQVAVSGPFGDDYMAAAALRLATPVPQRMLVLLVNRPSPLLDPVSVRLRITARRSLGAPVVRRLADPFTRPAGARTPALCNLPLRGSALGASQVRPLYTRGPALAGFGTASAVAQAYDVVCGLPYASSFAQAVEQSPPASPVPSPAPPAPSPAPPVGKLPGEGCEPTPGYACPVAVASALPERPSRAPSRPPR
jgi:hypothetical protein